jgi:hypothetical protein
LRLLEQVCGSKAVRVHCIWRGVLAELDRTMPRDHCVYTEPKVAAAVAAAVTTAASVSLSSCVSIAVLAQCRGPPLIETSSKIDNRDGLFGFFVGCH